MEPDNWLGCGVATHSPECLCDVVIPEGTDTSIRITDAVNMMWMGREVCDIRGYSAPWTNESILDYFTDLTRFYDVWSQSGNYDMSDGEPIALNEVPPITDRENANPQIRFKAVRDAVMYCMNRFDNTLIEILQHYGLSPDDFALAATGGKLRNITHRDIQQWDDGFMDASKALAHLATEFGLTKEMTKGLSKYWSARRARSPQFQRTIDDKDVVKKAYHHLCMNTDMDSTEIRDIMLREYGKTYDRSTIAKYRKRHGYSKPL